MTGSPRSRAAVCRAPGSDFVRKPGSICRARAEGSRGAASSQPPVKNLHEIAEALGAPEALALGIGAGNLDLDPRPSTRDRRSIVHRQVRRFATDDRRARQRRELSDERSPSVRSVFGGGRRYGVPPIGTLRTPGLCGLIGRRWASRCE